MSSIFATNHFVDVDIFVPKYTNYLLCPSHTDPEQPTEKRSYKCPQLVGRCW